MDRRLLLAAGLVIALHAVLPAEPALVVELTAKGAATAVFWAGFTRQRRRVDARDGTGTAGPELADGWLCIGATLTFQWLGDVVAALGPAGLLDDLLWLIGTAFAVTGALRLLGLRGSPTRWEALVDALGLTVGAAAVLWQLTGLLTPTVPAGERLLAIVWPTFAVLLLTLMTRLWRISRPRNRSLGYLVAALSFLLASDTLWALWPDGRQGLLVTSTSLAVRFLVAAAALTPAMRLLLVTVPITLRNAHSRRLLTVTSLLVGLSTLLGSSHLLRAGEAGAALGLAVGPLVLIGMLLTRLFRLLRQHERAQEQLARQALYDPLTGLPNRRLLLERVAAALARARATPDVVGIVFCDLDGFKSVNDAFGHASGDELLRRVAGRLGETLAPGDTLARLGGDEFVVCCEGRHSVAEVQALGAALGAALAPPFVLGGRELAIGASVGVTATDGDAEPEQLLREADAAMYAAKERGAGRVVTWDAALGRPAESELQLERELRAALRSGQLVLLVQPIADLASGHTVAVEALVRWRHPRLGLLAPAAFVPLAEQTSLIDDLGAWVVRTACRQVRDWQDRAGWAPRMSVNVSARQLDTPGFVALVRDALEDAGLEPAALCLELTETVLMLDRSRAAGVLTELRALGVSLAIDDFGTGYSSLAYLKWLPVDELKIDRSLVAGLGGSEHDDALVAAVVGMGHALGLRVLAEGVERSDQLAILRLLGCDLAQGYALGYPGPPEPLPPAAVLERTISAGAPAG